MDLHRILGIGHHSPLILGIGHPISERIKRLASTPKIPKGGIVAALIICLGLGTASVAQQQTYSLNEKAPLFTSDKGNVIQGVPFRIAYIDPEKMHSVLAYEIRGRGLIGPNVKDSNGYSLLPRDEGSFPHMPFLNKCIDHVYSKDTNFLWYEGRGKVFISDDDNSSYIVACIPGDRDNIPKFELGQIHSNILTSINLPEGYKADLQKVINSPESLQTLLRPSPGIIARARLIEILRKQNPAMTEAELETLQTSIQTEANREVRAIYKIDPNLSKEDRQKLMDEMDQSPVFTRSIALSPDLSEAEREKRLAEWRAEAEAEIERQSLARGLVKVNSEDDIYQFLDD